MVFYGGNEVSSLVFDIGANSSKVGYAGADSPSFVFSSVGAWNGSKHVLGNLASQHGLQADWTRQPVKHGLVNDWDALEAVWDHAYSTCLRTSSELHPLMLTQSAWADSAQQEKLAELAFEKYKVPGLYMAPSAVLAAFSAARSTALVIDSGADMTSIVPVVDSFVLKKGRRLSFLSHAAIQKQPLAGDFVSQEASAQMSQAYPEIPFTPQYLIKQKQGVDPDDKPVFTSREEQGSASFHARQELACWTDFKETVCCNLESAYDPRIAQSRPKKQYEFPNGFNTSLSKLRYQIPECLFDPANHAVHPMPEGALGVQMLAHAAVQACDTDLRSSMYTNVVLTGGNTLLPGFADRLHYELNMLAPGIKVRLHAAGSAVERKFGAWIGASILASLGTFHQLWISREEYLENGVGVVNTR